MMTKNTAVSWRIAEVTEDGLHSIKPMGNGPFTIGRARDCNLVLKDRTVSRYHAHLFLRRNEWWIVDLNSSGGTLVDGQSIRRAACPIWSGTRIRIPSATLIVFDPAHFGERIRLDRAVHGGQTSILYGRSRDRVRVAPGLQRILRSVAESESVPSV